ncbi:MAG TPA: YitT family protein, partial [Rikenellaceae bacterium]|nr:YitT family protein [Rikenellaceae bacterium]
GKYRNISPGRIMMSCDLVIIGSLFFISDEPTIGLKLAAVLSGYLIIGLAGYTVDTILSGAKRSVQYFIFSSRHQEIADRISKELQRGVTVISSQGWYTKSEQKVLLVIVRRTESNAIAKIIKEIDRDAFISMASVS